MEKFCEKCEKLLTVNILHTGSFSFGCTCGYTITPTDDDTLLYEQSLESVESNQKYKIYVTTAKDDVAAFRVEKECNKCKCPIMLFVRTGVNEKPYYTCKNDQCDNIIQV